MSRDSHDSTYGSWSKRKALFSLSSPSTSVRADSTEPPARMLKKHKKRPSILTDVQGSNPTSSPGEIHSAPPSTESGRPQRPSLSSKTHTKRQSSGVFSSLRGSIRSTKEEAWPEPLSAASTQAPSFVFGESLSDAPSLSKNIIIHGEVQTSAGMFRKKKEYLVLTENTITRYKSISKAAEVYPGLTTPSGRPSKHAHMPSYGSSGDLQTISDSSGDKAGRIALQQVVAVYTLDDGKPYFSIEVSYLDEDSAQAASIMLQFSSPQERDNWIKSIRSAVEDIRARLGTQMSSFNLENAARIIERDNDYDPANCAIYKVVQRHSTIKSSSRSSSDDLCKVATTVGFLAIGLHKVHLISLARPVSRTSSPSLSSAPSSAVSHGILAISSIRVSETDDSFDIVVRKPMQRAQTLFLASSSSFEIVARLWQAENFLRPEAGHRFWKLNAPNALEEVLPPSISTVVEDHNCLTRTLVAYCVAYNVNPSSIRYSIDYDCEDAPRFHLLPAADERRPGYTPLELLAIMRALRYNETFMSMSFDGILLDCLKGLHDNHGREYVCTRTKNGTMIKMSVEELAQACLLRQEIRALAVTNRKLRRLDFSGCIGTKAKAPVLMLEDAHDRDRDDGCGIVEALLPLCQHQTTNVDWICLNGIILSDVDLDYLVGAAVDRACHFRAIELSRCGLTDRSVGLILDALRAQDNTLESIELAGNTARIEPSTFDSQLFVFGFIRKLNLSNVSRTSGPEPILQADTLAIWRLSELRLSGTTLNTASVDALADYLAHSNSQALHVLFLDNTFLSGDDIAKLLQSMSGSMDNSRDLHLDISANNVCKDLEKLTQAISSNHTPIQVTMRGIEYREEAFFRKMLAAWTVNKSTKYLNISQTALPGDASVDTCRVLGKLIACNDSLLELNISGEESRLTTSMFGSNITEALTALKDNSTLKTFQVERQRLALPGAITLAETLMHNSSLQELWCGYNDIPLTGLTSLVNALVSNTTLIYLPAMDDGREAAFRTAEQTMKSMPIVDLPPARMARTPTDLPMSSSISAVKKGIAGVRRTAQRTATAYTPSFPALQSYAQSVSNPLPPSPPQMPMSRARQSGEHLVAVKPITFTIQDIQTTHRLLNEQWDRQCYRLSQYLDRNWSLLNNIPVAMEIEDEKFERPMSAGSLGKMLEQVKFDTTPRAEKDVYFDAVDQHRPAVRQNSSFKQFLLESGPTSPESEDDGALKQLAHEQSNLPQLTECKTPTQPTFSR